MTPNDNIPEENQEQIITEAEAYKRKPHYRGGEPLSVSPQHYLKTGYQAGATAWAGWKVRFDELKARCDKMAQLLYMLQSVHSHEWSEGNKENVKQTLQQWQQFKDWKDVGEPADDVCRCILPNWNAFTGKCLTCGKQ